MIQSHRLHNAKDIEKPFETAITGMTEPPYQAIIIKKSTPVSSHREPTQNFDTFIEIKQ
ncbi:hypothetical protein [Acetivibrio mesophilus]|uniref:hypothetical protein n=1 Tax=Acetivibrio mesophilus TaxID=2487273 RepID=UPI00147764D1|nr:hypothetical protein [Acetivibrio mesophilus]HHV28546.1 hypothetical protein [Clostridium sp.]